MNWDSLLAVAFAKEAEPYDPDAALRLFEDAADRANARYKKETGGKGVTWAKEYCPDLWNACLQAFSAVQAAFQAQDMSAVRRAVTEFEVVHARFFDAYVAAHAEEGKPETAPPGGEQKEGGENTAQQKRGGPPETLFPGLEGVGEVKQEKPDVKKTSGFISPWQDWLNAVPFTLVTDLAEWRAALEEARTAGITAIDTETTGLDPLQNRIRLVQVAVPVYPAGKKRLVAENGREPEPGGSAKVYVLDLFALPEEGHREAVDGRPNWLATRACSKSGTT